MERWPIPHDLFQSEATKLMKGSGCPIKEDIFQKLHMIHNEVPGQQAFIADVLRVYKPTQSAPSFLHNLQSGAGEKVLAASVWYEIHQPPWKHLADEIDRLAFKGLTFEERFPKECEPYLRAAGRWQLFADARPQAVDEFRWNFDLFDGQSSDEGGDVSVYLEACSDLEEVEGKACGFKSLRVVPRFVGRKVKAQHSRAYGKHQPAGNDASVLLYGSGRANAFWIISSNDGGPLRGRFSPEEPVMTIERGAVEFTAEMVGNSKDICDQPGKKELSDVQDAFIRALYAKQIGPRDERTGSITLFEMHYSLRRS